MSDMGARVFRAPRSKRELFRASRSKASEGCKTHDHSYRDHRHRIGRGQRRPIGGRAMITFRGGQQLANGRRTGLGSGFGGVVAYLMQGRREDLELAVEVGERVAWTETRNLPIDDPHQAARWMRAWANQNPRVKKPVYHFGAALAPDEHLSREQWAHVADRLLERLGLHEHQALIALHTDRDHEHIHIAVNRVGPDGRVWKPSYDALKQQAAARELERELGLRIVPTKRDQRLVQRRASGGDSLERRELEKPFAEHVRAVALEDFRESGSWEELEDRIARHGLRLEPAKRGAGVNVTDGHERAGIARIDRSLSGPRLADRYGEPFRAYRKRQPERPPLGRAFARPDVSSDLPIEDRAENVLRQLARERATWTEDDVRRLTDRDLDGDALLHQVFESDRVVSVGQDHHGVERFAASDYVAAEQRMFQAADRLAGRRKLQLERPHVGALLEERHAYLSHEQRDAVLHATTGDDLALIVGRAGAGKTRLTRAVVDAYREAGYQVQGAALAGKAADGLAAEAGIEARTLASYELGWRDGRGALGSRDVLIIDEAGMIDVRQMRRVLEHSQKRGAKIVLIGDPDQLKAIGAGDAFRGLIEQHGAARVDTIRRQAEPWQREASEQLADGHLEPALAAYAERGAIQWHTDAAQARDALVMRYFEDRYLAPDQSCMILAHRRADVRRLNEEIREVRRAAGELGPAVRLNGRELAAGDRVLFQRNDHTGRQVRTVEGDGRGVKNGALGTLIEVEPDRLRIRLDSGRTVELDPRIYDRLTHGYAVTVHKAQGVTVDRAYVLADRGFDRNLAYVALTRHRHQLALYVDRETFASGKQLRRVFAREPRKDLVRDYRPSEEPGRILEPESLGSPSDSYIPRVEPAEQELTPERLEQLRGALGRLERRDEIEHLKMAAERSRQALPYKGSLPDLDLKIRKLEQPPPDLDHDLGRIYRQPEAARAALEQYARDHGMTEAFRQLETAPEDFGRLRGRQILRQPSRARAEALKVARRTGSAGAKRYERASELRSARQAADRYRLEALDLGKERGALAPERAALVEELRVQAAGLDHAQLEEHLKPDQLKTLRDLRASDRLRLEPLQKALSAFHRKRRASTRPATRWRLAGELTSLYRATPSSLLRRLAPPQIRLLISAVTAAAAIMRKLAPEYEKTQTRRPILGP